uniref:Uncharacterized protein n=1 Tax=Anopheles farauti TaxID=69004 RepID=A0A182QIY4_9DIPT
MEVQLAVVTAFGAGGGCGEATAVASQVDADEPLLVEEEMDEGALGELLLSLPLPPVVDGLSGECSGEPPVWVLVVVAMLPHLPTGRAIRTASDDIQQGPLPATLRAEDGHHLPAVHGQMDSFQHQRRLSTAIEAPARIDLQSAFHTRNAKSKQTTSMTAQE